MYIKYNISKIVEGLDPAGPGFEATPTLGISSSNAKIVEIIHTNAGKAGLKRQAGHIDFYPNGGGPNQPGCKVGDNECSHMIVYKYYIESLMRPKKWIAVRCSDYNSFLKSACVTGEIVRFPSGSGGSKKKNGSYFLTTGDKKPFGLGMKGVNKKIRRTRLCAFLLDTMIYCI